MFDIAFNGAMAFQQVSMLIAAFFLVAFGAALLWDGIHAALTYDHVSGAIIGVRQKDNCYYPVYRYTLPSGETVESTADGGSSIAKGKETGAIIPLLVSRSDKTKVRPVKNHAEYIVGALLLAPGGFLGWLALTTYPVTLLTWVVLAGFAARGFMKFQKFIIPKEQRLSPNDWMASRKAARRKEMESHPVQPIEDILNSPEKRAEAEKQKKDLRKAAPIIAIFALVLMYAGYSEYDKTSHLEKTGLRAEGTVISLESQSSQNGYTYYPRVSFADKSGNSVTFKDRTGSNPPSYHIGEHVTVIYDPQRPQTTARIDHGFWNRVIPVAIFSLGALLLFFLVRLFA